MAISILKIPPRVHFIDNGLPFEVSSDNVFSANGSFAYHKMGTSLSSNLVPVDAVINVVFGDHNFDIVAKAVPDDSGFEFPAGDMDFHVSESLYRALINNPIVCLYYDVIHFFNNKSVWLKAKDVGEEWDVLVNLTDWGFVWAETNVPASDAVMRDNFYLMCKGFSFSEASEDFINYFLSLRGEDKIKPDANNKVIFDPSAYFATLFDYSFSFPISDVYRKVDNAIMKYAVAFSEGWGIPFVEKRVIHSSDFFALNGEIPQEKLIELNLMNTNWFDNLRFNKEFISLSPYEKLSSINTPEKIWFLAYDDFVPDTEETEKFQIKCNINFTDGTSAVYYPVNGDNQTMNLFEIFEFNCGYAALNIQNFVNTSHSGKVVASFTFQLLMNKVVISEEKKFTIDYRNNTYQRIFIFKNALGFYETLRLTGKAVVSNSAERQSYINNAPNPFEVNARNKFSKTIAKQQTFQISSGYFMDFHNAVYAVDAFNSNDVFEIVNGNPVPIIITSDDIKISKDGDRRYSFNFEYEFAFNSAVFPAQPDDPAGDFNYDFNYDFY